MRKRVGSTSMSRCQCLAISDTPLVAKTLSSILLWWPNVSSTKDEVSSDNLLKVKLR